MQGFPGSPRRASTCRITLQDEEKFAMSAKKSRFEIFYARRALSELGAGHFCVEERCTE